MDRIEQIAGDLAFKMTPLTPKGHAECKWPDDWSHGEQSSIRAVARAAYFATLRSIREPGDDAVNLAGEAIYDVREAGSAEALECWQTILTKLIAEVDNGD